MKVEHISVIHFKKFEALNLSLVNPTLQEVSNRFLILGENGSGKTTLLQAIALTLGLATRQIRSVSEFNWLGFVPGRYLASSWPRIELTVTFSREEIQATREISEEWIRRLPTEEKERFSYIPPGDSERVKLILNGETVTAETPREFMQFRGRSNLRRLMSLGDSNLRSYFAKLPGVFWFDQFRNLGIPFAREEDEKTTGRLAYEVGVAQLRGYLNGWKLAQNAGRQLRIDYLSELEKLYSTVFPGRSFAGVELMPGKEENPTPNDFYFLLNDGLHRYDLEEMSAGEQAVFPLLYDMVRLQITNSVVLIDEVDLNLHPPLAQSLVSLLPKIGVNCQYIMTTHSEAVVNVVSDDTTYRLEGNALCL